MKIKNYLILALVFVWQFLLSAKAFAAAAGIEVGVGYPNSITSGKTYTFTTYVQSMYAFSMKVAIALCTLMIIYAGYKYLTSRGDSGAINEAKDILFSTLMGAALLMLVVLVGNLAGIAIKVKP